MKKAKLICKACGKQVIADLFLQRILNLDGSLHIDSIQEGSEIPDGGLVYSLNDT